jgi:hypothetical protein
VVAIIVAVTAVSGAALSLAELLAGEPLLTVLTGLTLIASLAILASAITAAIYAKPAYDEAVSHLLPADLTITETLYDEFDNELSPTDFTHDGFAVYEVPRQSTCKLHVRVFNAGRAVEFVFNFFVPAECDLTITDPPEKVHYLAANRLWEIMGVTLLTKDSISRPSGTIARESGATYIVAIGMPDLDCPYLNGWPMEARAKGVSDSGLGVAQSWWVRTT